jgi:hypothetical protein
VGIIGVSDRTAYEHNLRVLLGCLEKALEDAEALIGEG